MGSSGKLLRVSDISDADKLIGMGAFKAQSADPSTNLNGVPISSGFLYTQKMYLPTRKSLSKLWTALYTGGLLLTAGRNFLALYNAAGTRVGVSADLTTDFATAQVLGASMVTPYDAPAGYYFGGILANGGTPPTFLSGSLLGLGSSSIGNSGLTAANGYRYGFFGSGLNTTPVSIDPTLIVPNITASLWMAVS